MSLKGVRSLDRVGDFICKEDSIKKKFLLRGHRGKIVECTLILPHSNSYSTYALLFIIPRIKITNDDDLKIIHASMLVVQCLQ